MSYTLKYEGIKFGKEGKYPVSEASTSTERLAKSFSNMGALVIRYQLGQGQRAGLIQQVARQNYEQNPVQKRAKGGDQEDLFEYEWDKTPTCAATQKLEECAHATLGRGKLLNERAQPLVHVNQKKLHGEQYLWDSMHATVWHTGIAFGSQLAKQGFTYISAPKGISPKDHQKITEALEKNEFTIENEEILVAGFRLNTFSPSKISLGFDGEFKETTNGMLISEGGKGEAAPMGWMLHKERGKIVPQDMLEDMIRIIRISKGGFFELAPEQQKILQGGLLRNNGFGLFTQNQTFNALYTISQKLEKDFGFDPEKLLGSSIKTTSKRVHDFFSKPENLEDFLTGALLNEMVQHLRVTQPASTRSELPLRFTNPFIVQHNNIKAIAHAFQIEDSLGNPVFQAEEISDDPRLIDCCLNGDLALPSLSLGKHAAAILSSAILVSEQMLLEQLIRESVNANSEEGLTALLEKITGSSGPNVSKAAKQLFMMASQVKKDENGPILGLQFDYCDPMVSLLRETLHFDKLILLVEHLEKEGIYTEDAVADFLTKNTEEDVKQPLLNLYRLAGVLQENPKTSAEKEGSKGILAGLAPLIRKISPQMSQELGIQLQAQQVPDFTKKTKTEISPLQRPLQSNLPPNLVIMMVVFALFAGLAAVLQQSYKESN
ncbi:MAG: Dot/Icm T4SS effector Ceg17 [Simkaniaceae bacterium]